MKKIILPLFFVLSVSGCSGSGMTESPLSSDSMPHSETHSLQSETEPYTLYIKTVRQYLSYAPTKIEVFQNGEPSTIDLYYEIEDEEVCTIENGYVTGLKIGETRVYASSIKAISGRPFTTISSLKRNASVSVSVRPRRPTGSSAAIASCSTISRKT